MVHSHPIVTGHPIDRPYRSSLQRQSEALLAKHPHVVELRGRRDRSILCPEVTGVASALLAMLVVFGLPFAGGVGLRSSGYRPMIGVTLSIQLQDLGATPSLGQGSVRNAPPAGRFEWTNPTPSHSSIFPLSQLGTNEATW